MRRWLIAVLAGLALPLGFAAGILVLARWDVGRNAGPGASGASISILPTGASWDWGTRFWLVYRVSFPIGGFDLIWTNSPWRRVVPVD